MSRSESGRRSGKLRLASGCQGLVVPLQGDPSLCRALARQATEASDCGGGHAARSQACKTKELFLRKVPCQLFGHLSGICRLEDQRQKKLSEPRTTVTSALRQLSYHTCLITIHTLKHSCGALRQAGKAPPARRLKASKLQGRSSVDHH